eukprot:349634-Chlamydomonas_euryale.AAC.5
MQGRGRLLHDRCVDVAHAPGPAPRRAATHKLQTRRRRRGEEPATPATRLPVCGRRLRLRLPLPKDYQSTPQSNFAAKGRPQVEACSPRCVRRFDDPAGVRQLSSRPTTFTDCARSVPSLPRIAPSVGIKAVCLGNTAPPPPSPPPPASRPLGPIDQTRRGRRRPGAMSLSELKLEA